MGANSFKIALNKKLGKSRVFFVCRDLERAIFTKKLPKNIFIITNWNDFSRKKSAEEKNIYLIRANKQLDTLDILNRPETKKIIKKNDYVLVFKNTESITQTIKENSWIPLNPDNKLSNEIEEKVSQYYWLGNLKKFLPSTTVSPLKKVSWKNKKFIMQFNRAHTGQGTFLIENKKQLDDFKKIFPERPVRVSRYIDGPVVTINLIIWGKKIFFGNPSYQITGLMPFTRNHFATIGNDWAFAKEFLTPEKTLAFKEICREVGKLMLKSGWQGLFGLDIIFSGKKPYLLEINARQPASTAFESQLQEKNKNQEQISVFEAHLGSLLKIKPEFKLARIKNGAQIIKRYGDKELNEKIKKQISKELKDFQTIFYNNKKAESDEVRIQSYVGLIKKHKELNETGKKIAAQFI